MIARIFQRIAQPQPAPPWSIIYAAGISMGAFAAVLIGTTIATFFGTQTAMNIALSWIIGMLIITFYVALTRNRTPADSEALGVTQPIPYPLLIILLSFGIGALLDLLSIFVTGTPSVIAEFVPLFNIAGGAGDAVNAPAWLLLGLLLVLFQPIAEGLVFRGVAYPALRSSIGSVQGFLMCALWHGVFHMVAYSTPGGTGLTTWWYTLILPILCGLYIGTIRAYTGSTRASILAHMGLGLFFIVRAITLAG